MRRAALFAVAAGMASMAMAAAVWAAQTYTVMQKSRSFSQKEITIAAGDTIRFGNDDEFIHQVYVNSDSFKVDTAESEPGNNIDVKFPTRGDFEVHCHIHPKMLLVVHVQ
jgi:plastocyanin